LSARSRQRDAAAQRGAPTPAPSAADWVTDTPASQGLAFYWGLVRARIGFVLLLLTVAIGTTAILVYQAESVYEAEADLLVTPIPDNNVDLFGLGLVSQSGDPTRDAETLAQLVTTRPVANRVSEKLGGEPPPASLLGDVTAEPVAQSSIVAITAKANDPEQAARLANEFARAAIDLRTERMQSLLNSVIPKLRLQLEELPNSEKEARDELGARLRSLETLSLLPDPTLHLETLATPPSGAISPRPVLSLAAATIAGIVLAFGIVLGAHFLDPRIEREEDLRRYRVPILGRIPRQSRGNWLRRRFRFLGQRSPLRPDELSAPVVDEFHRIVTMLTARTNDGDRSVFVTGTGPHIGKTTSALNLAAALASVGQSVMLVEADTRRPALAETLDLHPQLDVTEVLNGGIPPAEAFVQAEALSDGLQVLACDPQSSSFAPVSANGATALIREVTRQDNWLLVDGGALNYAPESLLLAKTAASVLVVVNYHISRRRDLEELAELMIQQGIVPAGFVIIGGKSRPVYR
jgi:succinoglycan biosynthesis transport protein ExoP